ncbi:hypothetical protein MARPO_0115s0005 [Marchantia polymorpha]|uniref:Uncharacterized protein n=1 Tax=Marchantia polymorpha TaxID=3197 RepID=A0A2R6WB52_MARPO|nr:hypothetical protein MARPO_0115s0005 [Marchantia polymorpha]|eukprot:PTQ31077.1 hypothetical protein MARPO_0115s0005 [Marchantia polymorpha]
MWSTHILVGPRNIALLVCEARRGRQASEGNNQMLRYYHQTLRQGAVQPTWQ